MSNIILHQYAESPFSEKIRALMGYKRASYQCVEIPMIMPRPDTIPLTGGYRKTPVMQIGADVFCDTAIICRVIDEMYPDDTIFPEDYRATLNTAAHWTDTFFFKVCVAIAFQPKAAATNPLFKDEAAAAAFMADRAAFSKGSSELGMAFEVAEPHFIAHLNQLDQQLAAGGPFLNGGKPTVLDFSTYHLVWFIYSREALRDYFAPFEHLVSWYEKIVAFGHGRTDVISGPDALDQARQAEPEEITDGVFLDAFEAGQAVSVMPIDYGFQPVTGELLAAGMDEIAVARTDEQIGRVVVHFPRTGFQISAVK
jgi:glutathione S-transferase